LKEKSMPPRYFIGVDAGGSHCRARLIDSSGAVLANAEAGPANARIGLDKLHAALVEICAEVLGTAGLNGVEAEVAAGFGIAGISREGVADALLAWGFPLGSVALDSDAAIANLGAHNGEDGATLILGTGSIGFVQANGRRFTIGGYGFPISDEGSGAALGLSAVRHALRGLDGRSKRTQLGDAVTGRFDHDVLHVIAWMDKATPADYGSIAPLVMDFAESGDELALSIVEDAALHVERFITTIFARGAPRLALAGGLAPRLKPWLRVGTAARLTEALGSPLDGALLLAGYQRPATN
jgi:glucosamine kinase